MTTTTARVPSGPVPTRPGHSGVPIRDTVLTAAAPVVWGTTYLVTTQFLPGGHPLFAAVARSLPAGLVALALTRVLPSGVWWWRSVLLGGLNIALFFPLLFIAAEHLPGGVAATLGSIQPLLVAGLAVGILGERPSWRRIAWAVVGVVGVGLVVLAPSAALSLSGIVAGLAGAVAMALGVVLTKRWGRPPGVTPMVYAGWQLTAGGALLVPFMLAFEGVPQGVDFRPSGVTCGSVWPVGWWPTPSGSGASAGCRSRRRRCSGCSPR